MPLRIGAGSPATRLYHGANEVNRAYLNGNIVFDAPASVQATPVIKDTFAANMIYVGGRVHHRVCDLSNVNIAAGDMLILFATYGEEHGNACPVVGPVVANGTVDDRPTPQNDETDGNRLRADVEALPIEPGFKNVSHTPNFAGAVINGGASLMYGIAGDGATDDTFDVSQQSIVVYWPYADGGSGYPFPKVDAFPFVYGVVIAAQPGLSISTESTTFGGLDPQPGTFDIPSVTTTRENSLVIYRLFTLPGAPDPDTYDIPGGTRLADGVSGYPGFAGDYVFAWQRDVATPGDLWTTPSTITLTNFGYGGQQAAVAGQIAVVSAN